MSLYTVDSLSQGSTNQTLQSIVDNFKNPIFVTEFVVSVVLVILFTVFVGFKLRNVLVWIFYLIVDLLFVAGFIMDMGYLVLIATTFMVGGTILFLFVNSGVIRKYVAIPLKTKNLSEGKGKNSAEQAKVHEVMIQNICIAVDWLSKNKVGALITFERDTPMDDFMKSGTIINCPVTAEIIETIFYEGTRLHDGAMIIRNDTIVAAAVYYPPSTKALTGKVGARHRAAMGISEVTDSVTIVVSEETGRIAIAHAGMMDNIKTDEFQTIFRNSISE